MKNKVLNEIKRINKQYEKDFKRKDLSFELLTIEDLIETCDNDVVLQYLLEEYKSRMKTRYDKLNSIEYKSKQLYL